MGGSWSIGEPITNRDTAIELSDKFWVGVTAVQGWRIDMEDNHVYRIGSNSISPDKNVSLFGVFDGHGGADVSSFSSQAVPNKIMQNECISRCRNNEQEVVRALQQGIMEVERDLLNENLNPENHAKFDLSGSTCIVVLFHSNRVLCANVGDSRAVASIAGNAVQISIEHKPTNALEEERILSAGAYVEGNRVNGNLALSRALGDFFFKRNNEKTLEEQAISAFPDVTVRELTEDWEFIVIACDGIWDVLANEEVVEFVRLRLAAGIKPDQICEDLAMHCMAPDCSMGGIGCDNMSVMIVIPLHDGKISTVATKCTIDRNPKFRDKSRAYTLVEHREDTRR